jgi:hypothetical protein
MLATPNEAFKECFILPKKIIPEVCKTINQ